LQNRWTALRVVGGFDSRPPPPPGQRLAALCLMPKKISTMFSHEHPVGRGAGSPRVLDKSGPHPRVLVPWVLVAEQVQLNAGMGGRDLLQELQELLVPVFG